MTANELDRRFAVELKAFHCFLKRYSMIKPFLFAAALALTAPYVQSGAAAEPASKPDFSNVVSGSSTIGAGNTAGQTAGSAEKTVIDALHSLSPLSKAEAVQKSDLPGFYEVVVNGKAIYISADGKYLVQGEIVDIPTKTNIGSRALATVRGDVLKKLPLDKRLIFAPPNPKYTVVVFTDVDCPYCRRFHNQIAAYNQLGIAVQYVLFPLTSIHPNAHTKAIAVWCSEDRNAVFTASMNGQDPGKKTCANPVDETTAVAVKMGVEGTPAMFTPDGAQITGTATLDPAQLLAELDKRAAAAKKIAAN
jgi:thiol:disulfide interchange protein DsbC